MKMISFIFAFFAASVSCGQDDIQNTVKRLGDSKFSVREKTQKELSASKNMGFTLLFKLVEINKENNDPEARERIEKLFANYCKVQTEYQVNLKGYKAFPFIDEGMPADYKLDGHWNGWQRSKFIFVYLQYANKSGALQDNHPNYTNYRKATQIWMQERINNGLKEAIRECKNEEDFRKKMQKNMEAINTDIEMLIQGDRKYYKARHFKNPFERESSIFEVPEDHK